MERLRFRAKRMINHGASAAAMLLMAFLFLLVCSPALRAEVGHSAESPRQIAVVISRDLEPYARAVAGFKDVIIRRKAGASLSLHMLNQGSAEDSRVREGISSNRWDLILCVGSEATRFVQRLETKGPIIFCVVSDPEGQGMLTGGHAAMWVAGVSTDIPVAVQFKKLREGFPDVRRVGVVYDERSSAAVINRAREEAKAQGLELIAVPVRHQREVPKAFSQLKNEADALWAITDRKVYSSESARFILTFALRNRLPFMAYSPQYVRAGALFALSCDYIDLGRQAGEMAVEVLKTGRLPTPRVIPPRKHLLSVNLRVMKVIGRDLPDYLVKSADRVFE